jgi:Fic family protein
MNEALRHWELFLHERGRLRQPLLYLSDYVEAHRSEYYDRLQRVRTHGDWEGWLRYFLTGVAETARKAVGQAAQLMDLRERLRRRLQDRPRPLALVDELFKSPYIDVAGARDLLRVTHPTARQVIRVLEEEGVLKEVTGRKWGRLFLARPILRAIEQPTRGRL